MQTIESTNNIDSKHFRIRIKQDSISEDPFRVIKSLYNSGNISRFEACKKLYELIEIKKIAKESVTKFYHEMGWSRAYGARLKKVGKAFLDRECNQMATFTISHLTRLAALKEYGNFIIDHQIAFTVDDLAIVAKLLNKKSVDFFGTPDDLIKTVSNFKEHGKFFFSDEDLQQHLKLKNETEPESSEESEEGTDDGEETYCSLKSALDRFETKKQFISHHLNILFSIASGFCEESEDKEVSINHYFKHLEIENSFFDWFTNTINEINELQEKFKNEGYQGEEVSGIYSQYPIKGEFPHGAR